MLKITFLNQELKNPITTGAGTFGYGEEAADFIDVSRLGAITVKGTSLHPWAGNPPPRIWETPSGMLNAIGLQNPGLREFIRTKLPILRQLRTTVIVSIFDKTVENYVKIAKALDRRQGVDILELNLSCPNIRAGSAMFCAKPALMAEVISKVKKVFKKPILAKLSPNVGDIVATARAAIKAGADGLTLINTLSGMSIDINTRRPHLYNNIGGLSGPAIHPVAVGAVFKVRRAIPDIPIVGIGGVYSWQTALEMILAGANLVGIGTACFYNPKIHLQVIDGLSQYCKANKIKSIGELVGKVREWNL